MDELFARYKAISVFSSVSDAIAPLAELCICKDLLHRIELCSKVFSAVAAVGADTTGEWIKSLILRDDNFFSRSAARGERISDRVKAQVKTELLTFKQLSLVKPTESATDACNEFLPKFGFGGFSLGYEGLLSFYALNGCGRLAVGSSFTYKDGTIAPADTDDVTLSDIKNYAEEKSEIVRNTENFINGLPAFHALLYGDRGTGKSTTVRAIAHDYADKLKVIELSRGDIGRLPELKTELSGLKQKFILFIDDLTFDENDPEVDGFKTALEGSLDAPAVNTLLYCTSNRRHLYKESERADGKRRNDDVQAELALFDRFGLVITYINPDKEQFVDILKQILRSRSVKWHDEYAAIAELAAIKKGGRSPRAAKQIADLIESNYARGKV